MFATCLFRPRHSLCIVALLAAFMLMLAAFPCLAATRVWNGNTSDLWSEGGAGGNWSNEAAPVNGDRIVFNANSTANLYQQNDIPGLSNMMINMTGNPWNILKISGFEIGVADGAFPAVSTSAGTSGMMTFVAPLRQDGDATIFCGGTQLLQIKKINNNGFDLTLDGGNRFIVVEGKISGSGDVTYQGRTHLYSSNTYTGASILNGAELIFQYNGSLPSGSAVQLIGASSVTLNSTITLGSLSGTGTINMVGSAWDLITGGDGSDTTFSGRFIGNGALIKNGGGTMTLSGNSTNGGAVQLNGGALVISGTMGSTSYTLAGGTTLRIGADDRLRDTASMTLAAGSTFDLDGNSEIIGRLSGAGAVTTGLGTLTIATALNPGTSPGVITIGNFDLSGGTLNAEIDGPNPGTGYDQITATGSATLGGNLNVASTHSPTAGDTFIIINKTSAGLVAGTFAGLAEGATVSAGGTTYRISYAGGDGNDVVLTAMASGGGSTPDPEPEPEPNTLPAPEVAQGSGPSPIGSLDGSQLSWPQVKGANYYRIYRAECPVCKRKEVGRVRENSFIDNTAEAGRPYYYWLRTENNDGLGVYSNWLAAWRYEQNPGRAGDFNGDGIMDLLWWNPDNNQLSIWFMNNGQVANVSQPGDGLNIAEWLLISTADFNGDGACDLLWWKPQTGETKVWYLDKAKAMAGGDGEWLVKNSADLEAMTGHAAIAYPGDLNGDGRMDILWRDYANGQVTVWLMGEDGKPQLNGPPTPASDDITKGERPGLSGRLEWQVAGLSDADANGKADVVWKDARNNRLAAWMMDGSNIAGVVQENKGLDLVWRAVGVGDLNADSQADIVWRNESSGAVQAWLMQAGLFSEERVMVEGSEETTQWQVKAVGDFCAAGSDDIYCKNSESSAARIVKLDGSEFTPSVE